MTVQEFDSELDIIYENINKNGAPGLDSYEKSVILSHAQEILVEQLIASDINASSVPELIQVHTDTGGTQVGASDKGYVFDGVTDSLKVLNDYIEDASTNRYELIGITSREYSIIRLKSYPYPPRHTAWKLSLKDPSSINPSVEVIPRSGVTPSKYIARYVRKPFPIILDTLTGGASIDGETAIHECELNTGLHKKIVNIAASLAEQFYIEKYGAADNK